MARRKKAGGGGGGGGGHDSGGMMRWLLTYADMITLLMAFFIMMYSMSVLNLEKFSIVAFSIRSGFGGTLKGGPHLLSRTTSGELSLHGIRPTHEHHNQDVAMKQTAKRIAATFMSGQLGTKISVTLESRGVVISIAADGLLFDRGSAMLTPTACKILAEVSDILRPLPNQIQVEGNTCSLPINTAQFPSNWELSATRSCSVVRFLQQQGIIGWRLSAVGYGDTRPRAPNDIEANRMLNRRVNIVILNTTSPPSTDMAATEKPEENPIDRGTEPVKPTLVKVWKKQISGGTP